MLDKWKALPKLKKFNIIYIIVSVVVGAILWKKHKAGDFKNKVWLPWVVLVVGVLGYIFGKKKLTT